MPETTSKNPRFARALRRMEETHDAKSHDYATTTNPYANFDFAQTLAARFGEPHDQVFATMVGIKLARLGELLGNGKTPKHESIDDTFLDLANYVVLWWTSRQRLADDAGAPGPKPRVAPDAMGLSRSELEHWASMQPAIPDTYISDGMGNMWLKCGPTCDLHMTHPGQVACRCHGHSDDSL
jgi:hypothetical protein